VFDLTFAICVLHHVPRAEHAAFASELARVTAPAGVAVVFEHNPLNPLTRLVVDRCTFDDDVELLRSGETKRLLSAAGLAPVESRYLLFTPWRPPGTAQVERVFGAVPLGAQYYVAASRSGAGA
jgi:SAM-dependent methyltransferase